MARAIVTVDENNNLPASVKGKLDANYAPLWQPSTAYAINAPVLLPNGSVGTRTAAGTSRAQFDATELSAWTIAAASTPDASDTTPGKVRLAGDLGGTAAAPEVFRTVQSGIRIARVFRGNGVPPASITGAVTGDIYEDRSTTPATIYDIAVS